MPKHPIPTRRPCLVCLAEPFDSYDCSQCLATVYSKQYGLEQAVPFMVYYVFSAAIMHVSYLVSGCLLSCSLARLQVYNTRWPGEAKTAQTNLAKCMKALKEMEIIWGSAARQRELLVGLVDLAEAEGEVDNEGQDDSMSVTRPPSKKRNADSQDEGDSPMSLDRSVLAGLGVSDKSHSFSPAYTVLRPEMATPRGSDQTITSHSFDPLRPLSSAAAPSSAFTFTSNLQTDLAGNLRAVQPQPDMQLSNNMFNDLLTSFLGNAAGTPMHGFGNGQLDNHINASSFHFGQSPPPLSVGENIQSPPWMHNWLASPPPEGPEGMSVLSAAALGDPLPLPGFATSYQQHTSDFLHELQPTSPHSAGSNSGSHTSPDA